jgi:signal peptidase II
MKVLLATLIVIAVDQAAKLLVKGFSIPFLGLSHNGMEPGRKMPVLGNWLNISFVENPGIALGIDFGPGFKTYLTVFTFIAAVGLFVYLYRMRTHSFTLRLSLALILGGAVGNLIDRAFYGLFYNYGPFLHGKVVDFIDVRMFNLLIFNKTIGNYVLNIADIAVSLGVILLLFSLSREKEVTPAVIEEAPANNFAVENKE